MANPIAAWLTFDQLSCKFENIGGRLAPMPPSQHPCLKGLQLADDTTLHASDDSIGSIIRSLNRMATNLDKFQAIFMS